MDKDKTSVEKRENNDYQHFLHIPLFSKSLFSKVVETRDYVIKNQPFPITSFLKTLWEMEKLLVTINFSFSHSVFCLYEEHSGIFIKLKIDICKLFQFRRV